MKSLSRPTATIVLIIIVAFFCIGRILLPYLSGETRDPGLIPENQPITTLQFYPTLKSHQFECLPQTALLQTGEVVNVIDGDTINIRMDDGKIYRLRYIGIDTPERDEIFYQQSTAKNKDLVDGKIVTLVKDVSETDRFGRLLRYVLVDEVFVNYELVIQGYAQAITYPPDISCQAVFQIAERSARENNLGLWSYRATSTP